MSPLIRRVANGIGANAIGQVATIVIQIVSLPLFLHSWGIKLYGEWLVISAIPAYFALSDIGFSSVAGNEVTMLAARKDYELGQEVFQSVWLLISIVSGVGMALVFLVTLAFPIEQYFNLHEIPHDKAAWSLILLCLYVLVGLHGGMVNVGYRCTGAYARGTLIFSVIRIVEFLLMAMAVYLGGGTVIAAATYLLVRMIGCVLAYFDMRRLCPWLTFGTRYATYKHIKRLAKPSIAFMAFPIGNALSLQGVVFIIGMTLGPVATVTFSTLRTLSRFPLQATNAVNSAIWPELSTAFGIGNIALAAKLHCRSLQASLLISILSVVLLLPTTPYILFFWSHNKIAYDQPVMVALLAITVLNAAWVASSVVMASVNKHQRYSFVYLIVTAVSVVLGFASVRGAGLFGVSLALGLAEIVMMIYVTRQAMIMFGTDTIALIKNVLSVRAAFKRS